MGIPRVISQERPFLGILNRCEVFIEFDLMNCAEEDLDPDGSPGPLCQTYYNMYEQICLFCQYLPFVATISGICVKCFSVLSDVVPEDMQLDFGCGALFRLCERAMEEVPFRHPEWEALT